MAPSSDKGRDGLQNFANKSNSSSTARSSSPGLFSRVVGLAQPTLKVILEEDLLFLHPTPKEMPAQDPVLNGTVILHLPKQRVVERLTVRLLGRQDVSFGDMRAPEHGTSLDKSVSICDDQVALEKGEHRFTFSIIVPSSTACYERSQHGRVRHTVTAKAKGLGQLGGDILSPSRRLILIVNPGGAGANEPPPGLNQRYEGVVDELGPYTMSLRSQHLMVGGLLLCRLHLFSPPTDLIIYSVKVKILQHFTVTSPSDSSRTATLPTDIRTVIHLDSSHLPNHGDVKQQDRHATGPLKVLKAGEAYQMHHLGRLLDHDTLRPSTSEHTDAAIRVRHEITMECTYQMLPPEDLGKGKEKAASSPKKLVVTKPLTLFSCCAFVDSLTLPVYSVDKPEVDESPPCLCGYGIDG